MPELPDVEVFKRYVDATSLHRTIETVHVRDDRVLEVSPATLRRHLKGSELSGSRRHGKLLFVEVSGGDRWLLLHFGMTGEVTYYEKGDEPPHTALLLDFEDGSHLAYRNQRTFGRVGLVPDVDAVVADEGLGPDPLGDGFGLRQFRKVLAGRRGTIKGTLMNQDVLAGLGNVYTDEALFRARIHPEVRAAELSDEEIGRIWRALKEVVDAAIDARADADRMPPTFLITRREEGAECPRCDGEVAKTEVSGRTTYYCPSCQPEPSG